MPAVYPFNAIVFERSLPKTGVNTPSDVSTLVAPPYDVLDAAGKAALLAIDCDNIVEIDLPHTPAKELGPPAAYARAAIVLEKMLLDGRLIKHPKSVMFAYRQTFADGQTAAEVQRSGPNAQRSGMACCVDAVPFGPRPIVNGIGGGILPHEETFSGPKADRLALMKATATQLSPVFGLHPDAKGVATALLRSIMSARKPDTTAATADGTFHELWAVSDEATINNYRAALATEDIFIADGHHRYGTGLNFRAELEATGPLPAGHPATRSMMVLVSMSDPGLVIWPTHRVLGGMKDYTLDAFLAASKSLITAEPVAGGLETTAAAMESRTDLGEQRFGLFDVRSGRGFVARPAQPDALAARFSAKPRAWRDLVVSFIQHAIVEEVCQPKLNGGQPIKWAFPHTIAEVAQIIAGQETGSGGGAGFAQLVVLVRPTPLSAVREISQAAQLMPQKSTFFYPKLATGLFIHALK